MCSLSAGSSDGPSKACVVAGVDERSFFLSHGETIKRNPPNGLRMQQAGMEWKGQTGDSGRKLPDVPVPLRGSGGGERITLGLSVPQEDGRF